MLALQIVQLIMQECVMEQNFQEDPIYNALYLLSVDKLQILNSRFYNNDFSASSNYQLIKMSYCQNIYISKSNFQINKGGLEGGILSIQESNNIEIINNSFLQNNSLNQSGGAISIVDCVDVEITENTFFNNHAYQNGGALQSTDTQNLIISSNYIQQNSCLQQGGGFYLKSITNLTNIGNFFTNNTSSNQGGGLVLYKITTSNIDKNTFTLNSAYQGGAIYSYSNINQNYTCLHFEKNYAESDGGALIEKTSSQIIFQNCEFQENLSQYSKAGAIYILSNTNITIDQCNFQNNTSRQNAGAVWFEGSTNTLINSSNFTYNKAQYNIGGVFLLLGNYSLKIKGCIIKYNSGFRGGAISIKSNYGEIILENTLIQENNSQTVGGAIDIETSQVTILGCEIKDNFSEEKGGSAYILSSSTIQIINSIFTNNTCQQQGGSLHITNTDYTFLKNSSFYQGYSFQAGAIYGSENKEIYLNNCIISDNSAQYGGGLYLSNMEKVLIEENTVIKNNQCQMADQNESDNSHSGGAYLKEIQYFQMSKSIFFNNSATLQGAGLCLVDLQYIQIIDTSFKENLLSFDKSLEQNDKGDTIILSKGGAIFMVNESVRSTIEFSQLKFESNSASSGSSICFFQFIESGIKIEKFQNIQIQNEFADIGAIRYFGNYEPEIVNQLQDNIKEGSNNFVILDQVVYFDYYTNEKIKTKSSLDFDLCLEGTFLKQGGGQKCSKCQDNGVCLGGYRGNYPKEEYWRSNLTSFNYIQCEDNPENCLGFDKCKEGYNGVLCQQCDIKNGYNQNRNASIGNALL
ncbi:Pectin lyase fold/virulence factor [Pseudocohnilembus persalinus]|uniref:Pectin lyase fold/virulence factor n=1 Tax=Pseudocohnilembus persalinus TaxID=266149 RepID=A0A0V0R6B5_PSEPJ|nr:Pectin lyase fold/virulence factor [Pseudocohnilembus persalinus]|eukprot:KRX10047.1 Pectin lyase fold/virulence factor [Pseudocohnilembus persalinus]